MITIGCRTIYCCHDDEYQTYQISEDDLTEQQLQQIKEWAYEWEHHHEDIFLPDFIKNVPKTCSYTQGSYESSDYKLGMVMC